MVFAQNADCSGSIERDDRRFLQHASQYDHEKVEDYPIAIWNAKFEHPDTENTPNAMESVVDRNVVDENFTPHFSGNRV